MSDCVERATPLVDLIRMLGLRDHLFVLERDRVHSIVTHADLGAAAVSMVVLAYILAFERVCRELLAVEQVVRSTWSTTGTPWLTAAASWTGSMDAG